MTENEFIKECEKINILLTSEQLNKFKTYYNLLKEWNEKFNLTAITEEKEVYLKHFYDSLCLSKIEKLNNKEICDFGTGAGFPGVPLAIVYNDSSFILVESNGKKVKFLTEVINKLDLKNIKIINERVENIVKTYNEKFDIVTCRAVSNINIILELSSRLIRINGIFAPLKSNIELETNNMTNELINKLGFECIKIIKYNLPSENSLRTIPIYIKKRETDKKYPRSYNVILKESKKIN